MSTAACGRITQNASQRAGKRQESQQSLQPSLLGSPWLQSRRLPAVLWVRSKSPQQTAARAAGPIFKGEQSSGAIAALWRRAHLIAPARCRSVHDFVPLTRQAFLSTACTSKQRSHALRLEARWHEENRPVAHV